MAGVGAIDGAGTEGAPVEALSTAAADSGLGVVAVEQPAIASTIAAKTNL